MPMQHVELNDFHTVQLALNYFDGHEVAGNVDQQPTPGKTRTVLNGHYWSSKSFGANLYQLQERLQSMQHAQRGWSIQTDFSGSHFQPVRFVLSQPLGLLSISAPMDDEVRRCCMIGCRQRDSCDARKGRLKTLRRVLHPHVVRTLQGDPEVVVDQKSARPRLDLLR